MCLVLFQVRVPQSAQFNKSVRTTQIDFQVSMVTNNRLKSCSGSQTAPGKCRNSLNRKKNPMIWWTPKFKQPSPQYKWAKWGSTQKTSRMKRPSFPHWTWTIQLVISHRCNCMIAPRAVIQIMLKSFSRSNLSLRVYLHNQVSSKDSFKLRNSCLIGKSASKDSSTVFFWKNLASLKGRCERGNIIWLETSILTTKTRNPTCSKETKFILICTTQSSCGLFIKLQSSIGLASSQLKIISHGFWNWVSNWTMRRSR